MIDLIALSDALLVLEQGSFRGAAVRLGVRPSVVSRRVRGLEDALGVSLFQRLSQGAQPTSAGRLILNRGRVILADLADLSRMAALSGSGSEGRLCIGVVASIAGGTARDILQTFLAANPAVELDIVEGSPRDHVAAVRTLRMDLTFVVGTPPALGCEVEPLWIEPILVALPIGHPLAALDSLTWEQLVEERFIVSKVDPGPEIQDFVVKHLAGLGRHPLVEPRPVLREGLMAMIRLGRGISLVGAAEAAVTYPGVAFRTLAGETISFSAIWSSKNDNPALRRFLSLARIEVRRLARREAALPDALLQTPDPSP